MRRVRAFVSTAGVVVLTLGAGLGSAGAAQASGLITGSVDDSATGAPVAGVCVYAYAVNGAPGAWVMTGTSYRTRTSGDGSYELSAPIANYVLRFDPSCGGTTSSPFAAEYYLGRLDLETATSVSTSALSPVTGINAHLVPGFSLSGTVTAAGAAGGVPGVCVSAYDSAGHPAGTSGTVPGGGFTIGNLPGGTYRVYFDPTCGGSRSSIYAPQYYGRQVLPASGGPLVVTASVAGVDATLVPGAVVSGRVTAPGAFDNAGICVYAIGATGDVAARAGTNATGAYEVTNLPAGSFIIRFDPSCQGSQTTYFSAQPYFRELRLTAGASVPGVDASLRLRYGPRLAITLASLPAGRVYSSYFQALSITGPSTEGSDYAWHVTGLPRGLFADRMSLSEAIAGRPQVAGKFTVTATVTTITSVPPFSAHRTFRLLVKPASPGRGYPRPMGSRSA